MLSNLELLLFLKHLRQLDHDYKKCDDPIIKEKIKEEITFFSEIINIT